MNEPTTTLYVKQSDGSVITRPALGLNSHFCFVVWENSFSLTHIPTTARICPVNSSEIAAISQLLTDLWPVIEKMPGLDITDITQIKQRSKLSQLLKTVSELNKIWKMSEVELMVGAFWRDRQDIQKKLQKYLPAEKAEHYARLNTAKQTKETIQ